MRIYKTLPKGFELVDPARSLEQAKEMVKGGYGKGSQAVIIKTGKKYGNEKVFPYHVAVKQSY